MKTLYLSDLDGTLLNDNAELTNKSAEILNELIKNGMNFSVATARTNATVLEMFHKVDLNFPLILMNGVVIFSIKDNKNLVCHNIDNLHVNKVLDIFNSYGKSPMLYYQRDGYLEIAYRNLTNDAQKEYVSQRSDMTRKRFLKVDDFSVLPTDDLIYIVSLDYPDEIKGIYDDIIESDMLTCAFYKDNYTDCNFLECMSKKASKASAALELKKLYGFDRIVAFGDNLNDIPLFELADEAYAVSNACDELKSVATGVIDSNNDDAVAEFLLKRYNNNEL